MAIYTELTLEDAAQLAEAHGMPKASGVRGVVKGSVNSNYFVDFDGHPPVFARVYEEQDADGVAFEWRVLDHLAEHGVPAPRRLDGPGPGALRVAGKPTALFEAVGGDEVCQAMVDPDCARRVGALLAELHRVGAQFDEVRRGRFEHDAIGERLDGVAALERPELADAVVALRMAMDEAEATLEPLELAEGLVHGDLFRDNVRWEGGQIEAVLDWESASTQTFVYDLAVTVLAWCYGDALDLALVRAMFDGYRAVRPPTEDELGGIEPALWAAASRFTVTRITDFHLREDDGSQVKKDWRRFLARLEAVRALERGTFAAMLRGDDA